MPARKTKEEEQKTEALEKNSKSSFEQAKEKIYRARDATSEFIKDKPITSIAIAAGIGAVVGAGVALGVAALFGRKQKSFWENIRDLF